jgi:putative phosphotransacetylase
VHLSAEDYRTLFGDAEFTNVRELSQPGQFLSDKKVDIVGPKRTIEGVSVLGPARPQSQVEISRSDCFALGLRDVPVRQSGDLKGTPGITLRVGDKQVVLSEGVIVMMRHVHLDTRTAAENGFVDKQIVSIKIGGARGGILAETIVRVHDSFGPAVHLDSDEGNAMGVGNEVEIIA